MQQACIYIILDFVDQKNPLQHLDQRRIVQQRDMVEFVDAESAQDNTRYPAGTVACYAGQVRAVYVIYLEVSPDIVQACHSLAELAGMNCQCGGIECASGSAAYDVERICRPAWKEFSNGIQNAHLISGACAASGQDQG